VAEGQCVIVTSDSFAFVDGQLWLHNIYLRHHRAASASVGAALPQTVSKRALSTQLAGGPPTLIHASAEATALYMTDVCLQGNGVLDIVGLSATCGVGACPTVSKFHELCIATICELYDLSESKHTVWLCMFGGIFCASLSLHRTWSCAR
jgi:hypothetical protein